MSQANSMRKRHRFNTRMTRIVLLISFLFFFGRFVYSSIGAWQHHQDKKKRNSHRFLSPHRDNVKLLSVKKPAQEKALALTQKTTHSMGSGHDQTLKEQPRDILPG